MCNAYACVSPLPPNPRKNFHSYILYSVLILKSKFSRLLYPKLNASILQLFYDTHCCEIAINSSTKDFLQVLIFYLFFQKLARVSEPFFIVNMLGVFCFPAMSFVLYNYLAPWQSTSGAPSCWKIPTTLKHTAFVFIPTGMIYFFF